jgi:hypothetical protein
MTTLPPDWSVAGAAPWEVHRRWVTRLGRENFGRRAGRRFRRSGDNLDVADAGCFPDLDGILFAIVALILFVLFVIFVLPLLLVAVEILIGAVVLLLGLVAKIVLRRPWAIDAFARDGTHLRWKEVGWRATTARVEEITAALSHGVLPPGVELVHAEATALPPPAAPPDWGPTQGPFGGGS